MRFFFKAECFPVFRLASEGVNVTNITLCNFYPFLIGHYQKMERLKDVEQCLVHLDLVNLDIDQVNTVALMTRCNEK